jgi:hypothetical protein
LEYGYAVEALASVLNLLLLSIHNTPDAISPHLRRYLLPFRVSIITT